MNNPALDKIFVYSPFILVEPTQKREAMETNGVYIPTQDETALEATVVKIPETDIEEEWSPSGEMEALLGHKVFIRKYVSHPISGGKYAFVLRDDIMGAVK